MDLLTVLVDHLLKIKKEHKNLKKQDNQDILIQMIKLAFNMIWLLEILRIYL